MKAVVWHGRHDVRTETVPDPTIEEPTDAIVRITSTGLCGSDLHLYTVMAPFMTAGDVLGHEPMGIVEAVGSAVTNLSIGDRVVVPFNIACGHCYMCGIGLQSQCETTQVHEHGTGAALFGYTKLYGQVPGGQAELLRVPHADYGPIVVPDGHRTTASCSCRMCCRRRGRPSSTPSLPKDGSLVVLGLGPIGDMSARVARQLGVSRVIGIDLVRERLDRAAGAGDRRARPQ